MRQRVDGRAIAAIFCGGFLGTVVRAELSDLLVNDTGQWPWATFMVNIVGAFALGYIVATLREGTSLSLYRRPFLATGLCGGLTTFSTLQVELVRMLVDGHVGLAAVYAVASIGLGFPSVALGAALSRRPRVAL
jgi:CrcB protein